MNIENLERSSERAVYEMNEKEWHEEKQRLEEVRSVISRQMGKMREVVQHRKADALDIRKHLWDEISINKDHSDDLLETQASIIQQSIVMKGQEQSQAQAEQLLKRLEKQWLSPYFGRVDFVEQGSTGKKSFYIGISSLHEEGEEDPIIYDWRAPVSQLFYDHAPGPASYEAPEEVVHGEITLKRQYVIRQGQLENMFDTGVHIVDDMLQHMLGRNAEEKMKSIVTTIQKEQNEIIREDQHPLIIVQGAAGSGKTSVALQRVAYLLYKYRNTLDADQMLLFSPNSLFNDYVSTVLPELGERNMRQTTFQQYLEHRLDTDWKLEDAYDQLESLLLVEDENELLERQEVIRFKASADFVKMLNAYAVLLQEDGMRFIDFAIRGGVVISGDQMRGKFYEKDRHLAISRRLEKFQEWLLEELSEKQKQWTRAYYRKLLKVPQYIGTEEELKAESIRVMRRRFTPLRQMVKKLQFIDLTGMYRCLFEDEALCSRILDAVGMEKPAGWEMIRKRTLKCFDQKMIPYEDSVPLLYFKELLEGFQVFHGIRHVVIDEAQDYTPFQFEILKRMFPRSKMTLLGDLNQGIFPHTAQKNYEIIRGLFGEERTRMFRLFKSYRSTQEIVEFTRRLLPGGEPIEAISRHGELPQIVQAEDDGKLAELIAADVRRLQQLGNKSIAIICKTMEESKNVHKKLRETLSPVLVHKYAQSFVSGLLVIPAYLAKGLEFDAVIIHNAGAQVYRRESERKLLYTACTRALHHLHIFYTGELTPLIGADAAGTYVEAAVPAKL